MQLETILKEYSTFVKFLEKLSQQLYTLGCNSVVNLSFHSHKQQGKKNLTKQCQTKRLAVQH